MMQLGVSTIYVHGGHLVHVTWTFYTHFEDPHEIWLRLSKQLLKKKNFENGRISLVSF